MTASRSQVETLTFRFGRLFEWALPPDAPSASERPARVDQQLYAEYFRWLRRERAPEFCGPNRVAREVGWVLRSPVDVLIAPVDEVQFEASESEIASIANQANLSQVWKREGLCFGIRTEMSLRLYDFRTESGWEAMFLVNGDRSVEWRLGLTVKAPKDWGVLVIDDFAVPSVGVVPGVLTCKQLVDLSGSVGLSIAIRPQRKRRVERGDSIARLIPIHLDALRMVAETD